jgi:zinc protease
MRWWPWSATSTAGVRSGREDVDFPSTQTHLLMGQPGMSRKDPDYFTLYVGNYVLGGGGLVSRLADQVREQRGLAYSVYSYFMPMHAQGPFIIGLQTRSDQINEALDVVRDTVSGFVENGPTDAELTAAKRNLTGGFPLRIDSNGKICEYLAVIGFYDLPLSYLDDFPARVEAVNLEDVKDAFRRRVQPGRMVTVTVGARNQGDAGS